MKIYCLMGKSASGKDSIYRRLLENPALKLQRVIPYTTRPIREGEADGREYYFATEQEFRAMEDAGKVVESRCYETYYGPWYYYTADDGQINPGGGNYLMIGTIDTYLAVRSYYGPEHVVPVYVEVEDGLRLERAIAREKRQEKPGYEEMCRRFLADARDFSEERLKNACICKRFENLDLNECTAAIAQYIRDGQES